MSVLDEFIAEECDPSGVALVRNALSEGRSGASRRLLEFDRFELDFDFDRGVVLIIDVVTARPEGIEEVPIERFRRRLESTD